MVIVSWHAGCGLALLSQVRAGSCWMRDVCAGEVNAGFGPSELRLQYR